MVEGKTAQTVILLYRFSERNVLPFWYAGMLCGTMSLQDLHIWSLRSKQPISQEGGSVAIYQQRRKQDTVEIRMIMAVIHIYIKK